LQSKSYLSKLYAGRHLSAHQIARLSEVSRSTALGALGRFGILQSGKGRDQADATGQGRRLVATGRV
jgi:hypothetical protein